MTNLRAKRAIAASILRCGVNRVWIDPERIADVAQAITKADIRKLISEGAVGARPVAGVSRARAKAIAIQKYKGRRSGHGVRKGRKFARTPRKSAWMSRIRAIRAELRALKAAGELTPREYRRLYHLADSGSIKTRAQVRSMVKRKGK